MCDGHCNCVTELRYNTCRDDVELNTKLMQELQQSYFSQTLPVIGSEIFEFVWIIFCLFAYKGSLYKERSISHYRIHSFVSCKTTQIVFVLNK